jgi:hypothetical protein
MGFPGTATFAGIIAVGQLAAVPFLLYFTYTAGTSERRICQNSDENWALIRFFHLDRFLAMVRPGGLLQNGSHV